MTYFEEEKFISQKGHFLNFLNQRQKDRKVTALKCLFLNRLRYLLTIQNSMSIAISKNLSKSLDPHA
jgi:hypothetical protein